MEIIAQSIATTKESFVHFGYVSAGAMFADMGNAYLTYLLIAIGLVCLLVYARMFYHIYKDLKSIQNGVSDDGVN